MKRTRIFLFGLLACGIVLRLLAARGDLWLDEAMSLLAVRSWQANNPFLVFGWVHDNNHPLNSLWMYFVREAGSAWWYRVLSLLSGVGSLILIFTWPSTRTRSEQVILTVLWSFSYLLCLYDSEARGYAPMLFGGLLAWRAALEFEKSSTWYVAVLINAALVISCLAHVVGIYWLAFVAAVLIAQGGSLRRFATRIALLVPTIVFLGVYYWTFIRLLPDGSGALRSYTEVLLSALSLAAGAWGLSPFAPREGLLSLLAAVLFCALLIKALFSLGRINRGAAVSYGLGIFILPTLVLVVFVPRVLYERYLLVPIALSYFPLAFYLSLLWDHSKAARIFVCFLLSAYVSGNSLKLFELLAHGRGSYSQAFHEMAQSNIGKTTRVSFDQLFRGEVLVQLYGESEGIVVEKDVAKSDWYVLSSQERGFEPPGEIDFQEAGRFALERTFWSAPLSGFTWFIYQRAEDEGKTTVSD